MSELTKKDVTILLNRITDGENGALKDLFPLVYKELKKIAGNRMKNERPDHTLGATALVHEAYFKLIDQDQTNWQNRSHFFSVAAEIMRRILMDHARAKKAEKRGKGQVNLELKDNDVFIEGMGATELLELDEALNLLKKENERIAKVVELKFFGGLGIEEIAELLDTSAATVKRDWVFAKAWLYRHIQEKSAE